MFKSSKFLHFTEVHGS